MELRTRIMEVSKRGGEGSRGRGKKFRIVEGEKPERAR